MLKFDYSNSVGVGTMARLIRSFVTNLVSYSENKGHISSLEIIL